MAQERTFSDFFMDVRFFRSLLKLVKEHEAASFSLIASLGQKQTFCDYPPNVRFRG